MPEVPVIVVGAGLAGLGAAAELARSRPVLLVERLPAAGGTWEFDHALVRRTVAECRAAGVELLLGVSALRWVEGRLLVVGPSQVRWLDAAALVFAGGTRPATAAELQIAGGRLSGIFAVTVAHHLLDAGVVLGRRSVVVGDADSAAVVLPELTRHGTVDIVGGEPPGPDSARGGPPDPRVRWWPGFRAVQVTGTDRVSAVVVEDSQAASTLDCDCLILAAGSRPWRNVDGAIAADSPGVFFAQPVGDGLTAEMVLAAGRSVGREVASHDLDHPRPVRTRPRPNSSTAPQYAGAQHRGPS